MIRQKRLQIDQWKVDRVKRLLGVKTETMENKSVLFPRLEKEEVGHEQG